MKDENHREEELEEGGGEEPEKKRGYKPIRKTMVFSEGLKSIWNKRRYALERIKEEVERAIERLEELNRQEVEYLTEQRKVELERLEKKHRAEIERLNERIKAQDEELAAARGMVRELQKELESEKDKRRRGIPLVEGEDEEWNPDEERAKERVGDGRDESWLRK